MGTTPVVGWAAAVVLALGGCAQSSADEPLPPSPAEPATGAETTAEDPAREVADLDFTGVTLEGQRFAGEQLAGAPAVLWFWSPWCPTCRAQAPAVSRLAQTHHGEVAVIGVGGLADPVDIRDVAVDVAGPTHLVDEQGALWRHFEVTAQSAYVVIDADGVVVSRGYLDDGALAALVADLVG